MGNIWISAWKYCDWAGKVDILLLLFCSVFSWYIIIEKFFLIKEVKKKHTVFEHSLLKKDRKNINFLSSPLHNIFRYGKKLIEDGIEEEKLLNQLEKVASLELEKIESKIGSLLVISTVSPFLGLWGTVWGLLLAFNNMALSGSSSIRVVASGVAEALITTVIGLLVAIPAATGYHYFMENLKRIAGKIDFLLPQIVNVLKKEEIINEH